MVMKGFTAVSADGEAILYEDRKRWLWALSLLYPLQPLLGIWLHYLTGVEAWLLLPLLTGYLIAPLMDWQFVANTLNCGKSQLGRS